MLFQFPSEYFFVGNKVAADHLKEPILTSLKARYRLKFAQDVASNHVIDKGNYDAKSHITYLRNNIDMIYWSTYLHFQP